MPTNACPICGGELQATVVRYLSGVELDERSWITKHHLAACNDPDGYAWDHPAVRVYCENDHELTPWETPLEAGRNYIRTDWGEA